MSDPLYLILPYFNFADYKSSIRNLNIFLKNYGIYNNLKIVLVEGYISNNNQLDDLSSSTLNHVKVKLESVLWAKENLINIGFNTIKDWQYGCWIDRDIQFVNPNWVTDCVEKLKTCDIMQPFTECLYLDSKFELSKDNNNYFLKEDQHTTITSFCNWLTTKEVQENKNVIGHAGHAWAINRTFYDKIGGLCDKCIIGGGDNFTAQALSQNINHFHYRLLGKTYSDYCEKLKDAKVGFTNGLILHHFHGNIKKRNYAKRFEIFYKRQFNIEMDLEYKNGVLCLSESGKKFQNEIKEYFISRNEDNI